MKIKLLKDLLLERGVTNAGTVVEVEEQHGRELLRLGYAEAASAKETNTKRAPKGKAQGGAPENKAHNGAPANKAAEADGEQGADGAADANHTTPADE